MERDIQEIVLTSEVLEGRVKELGQQITEDYRGKDLMLVGVLKGAFMFMGDLSKYIQLPISIDFMAVSSYGKSTESSGVVKILKDLDTSIEGKDILLIEDIIDSGLTLKYLKQNLESRGASSVKICALIDKPERRHMNVQFDYKGFTIPSGFLVGYGLDYGGKYRNLPYIGILKENVYK